MKYRECNMWEAVYAMIGGRHVESECSGYGWRRAIVVDEGCYERVVWNDCQDVTIPMYLNRKWRIAEEESKPEWEEWERDAAYSNQIMFKVPNTYGNDNWVGCMARQTKFCGFVFRREGMPDVINFGSPVMGKDKTTGELSSVWAGCIDNHETVYADAVRMRREGE